MFEWLRQPTGEEESRGRDGKTASVRWVAAGYASTQEALASVLPINYNDYHPDYGSADKRRCSNIRVVASGFKLMYLEALFSVPEDGTVHKEQEPDETNPLVYTWATVQESVPVNRDRSGNPLVTSARRMVEGIAIQLNYKRLTITRWESSYNVETSLNYENTVNSVAYQGGAAGTVKCSIIQPSQGYTVESELIPIDYVFDFKSEDIWGSQPHQTQFTDADVMAYASIGGTAKLVRICDASGNPLPAVLLDGLGRPVDSTVTYIDPTTGMAVSSPTWSNQGSPTGATAVTSGSAKMLRYYTLPERDFNALGL